ncbi:unnamed protein product [Ixodes pacificus]
MRFPRPFVGGNRCARKCVAREADPTFKTGPTHGRCRRSALDLVRLFMLGHPRHWWPDTIYRRKSTP